MGIRVLVLAVVLLVPKVAFAETAPPPPAVASVDERSPAIALGLSAGITASGVALFFSDSVSGIGTGVVLFALGPTTGHWYAGHAGNGGTIARIAGLGVMALGVTQIDAMSLGGSDDDGALGIMVTGAALYTAGAIYEIYSAPGAVREHNARRRQLAVTPLVSSQTAGLAMGGSF